MDMDLIDKNAKNFLYEKVPATMTGLTSDETVRRYVQQLHAEWADTD